jgi:hypothetical protein
VNVERHFLRVRGPTLVAETVVVLAVGVCGEGVIFVGDGLLVILAVSQRVLDLSMTGQRN